jgi:MFS family permease
MLLPALVLIGVTVGAIDPLERAVRQERTPAHLRGRVFSAMYAVPKVAAPLGVFSAGLLVELAGLRGGLLAFAVGNAIIAVGLLVIRGVATLDDQDVAAAERIGNAQRGRMS